MYQGDSFTYDAWFILLFRSPYVMEELYALMQSCWKLEPSDRIATSILETRVNELKKLELKEVGEYYEKAYLHIN